MAVMVKTITGASSAPPLTWNVIKWHQVNIEVKQLQMRIAKAVREKRYGKAKALQWLLTHSFSAKLLAVKRVVLNSGAKTPGVDGVVWKTQNQKMQAVHSLQRRGYQPQPLRRIYIPKKQKGQLRPLSIPCLIDRGMQALHFLALEPVMETEADKNAYGFRPKRSCADAIEKCFTVLARRNSAPWILEGDIRACFDRLSGKWLEDNILTDKVILSKWLTAGYMEEKVLHPTFNGVPQGGVISPALLVLALKGFEKTIKSVTSRKDCVNVISYADDFVITGATKEVLENKVIPAVVIFLKERGLELSIEKTKITHIDDGFDFLGFNVRKYKGKLLIKPSKENVKIFLDKIRVLIKTNATVKTEDLIQQLNPKVRGWANYYRHVVSKAIFSYVDKCIFKALMRWIDRRHPEKNTWWKKDKYFRSQGMRQWIFSVKVKNRSGKHYFLDLFSATQLPIRRHIKIRAEANPYDPQYADYFSKRERLKNKLRIQDREFLKPNLKVSKTNHRTVGSCKHGL
jgi:RNA-directed DNA polymerase